MRGLLIFIVLFLLNVVFLSISASEAKDISKDLKIWILSSGDKQELSVLVKRYNLGKIKELDFSMYSHSCLFVRDKKNKLKNLSSILENCPNLEDYVDHLLASNI